MSLSLTHSGLSVFTGDKQNRFLAIIFLAFLHFLNKPAHVSFPRTKRFDCSHSAGSNSASITSLTSSEVGFSTSWGRALGGSEAGAGASSDIQMRHSHDLVTPPITADTRRQCRTKTTGGAVPLPHVGFRCCRSIPHIHSVPKQCYRSVSKLVQAPPRRECLLNVVGNIFRQKQRFPGLERSRGMECVCVWGGHTLPLPPFSPPLRLSLSHR